MSSSVVPGSSNMHIESNGSIEMNEKVNNGKSVQYHDRTKLKVPCERIAILDYGAQYGKVSLIVSRFIFKYIIVSVTYNHFFHFSTL